VLRAGKRPGGIEPEAWCCIRITAALRIPLTEPLRSLLAQRTPRPLSGPLCLIKDTRARSLPRSRPLPFSARARRLDSEFLSRRAYHHNLRIHSDPLWQSHKGISSENSRLAQAFGSRPKPYTLVSANGTCRSSKKRTPIVHQSSDYNHLIQDIKQLYIRKLLFCKLFL
jgi:hypothetical protein